MEENKAVEEVKIQDEPQNEAQNEAQKEPELQDLTPAQLSSALANLDTAKLDNESQELLQQIIAENNVEKAKDLTFLFNVNQNKKTLIRVNKYNDLLNSMTDQALKRFKNNPDEISNKELFDGMKIINDLAERGQSHALDQEDTPLIQINQQDNSINMKDGEEQLGRDSREKVKNAVLALLGQLKTEDSKKQETEAEEVKEEEKDNGK